jgi:hypothetical protein
MLLTAIYAILKNFEAYNPTIYRKVVYLPDNRESSVEQAIVFVQRHGFLVVDSDGVIAS